MSGRILDPQTRIKELYCLELYTHSYNHILNFSDISSVSELRFFRNALCGSVAQLVRTPNSNRKVANSMPTLGITRCCGVFV